MGEGRKGPPLLSTRVHCVSRRGGTHGAEASATRAHLIRCLLIQASCVLRCCTAAVTAHLASNLARLVHVNAGSAASSFPFHANSKSGSLQWRRQVQQRRSPYYNLLMSTYSS